VDHWGVVGLQHDAVSPC